MNIFIKPPFLNYNYSSISTLNTKKILRTSTGKDLCKSLIPSLFLYNYNKKSPDVKTPIFVIIIDSP